MRFCFCFLGLAALLAACTKAPSPVRLDFVGATNLTSSNRLVNAADTTLTYAYAEQGTDGAALSHLKITVTYSPDPEPIVYPALLSSYVASNTPTGEQLTMLDMDLPKLPSQYLFRPTFGARSTSGNERWEYTVTDVKGQTATRAYRLTVHKPDSAAVYQSYTVLPRLVPNAMARVYLALTPGLLLPHFAVDSSAVAANQNMIDLVVVNTNNVITLQAPHVATLPATWASTNTKKRTTRLRLTTLDGTGFAAVVTAADLATAFKSVSVADTTNERSGPVSINNVFAFRTSDGKYGLLYVSTLTFAPVPALTFAIHIQK